MVRCMSALVSMRLQKRSARNIKGFACNNMCRAVFRGQIYKRAHLQQDYVIRRFSDVFGAVDGICRLNGANRSNSRVIHR